MFNKKWITWTVIALVVYVLWRKFGGNITGAISSATSK